MDGVSLMATFCSDITDSCAPFVAPGCAGPPPCIAVSSLIAMTSTLLAQAW